MEGQGLAGLQALLATKGVKLEGMPGVSKVQEPVKAQGPVVPQGTAVAQGPIEGAQTANESISVGVSENGSAGRGLLRGTGRILSVSDAFGGQVGESGESSVADSGIGVSNVGNTGASSHSRPAPRRVVVNTSALFQQPSESVPFVGVPVANQPIQESSRVNIVDTGVIQRAFSDKGMEQPGVSVPEMISNGQDAGIISGQDQIMGASIINKQNGVGEMRQENVMETKVAEQIADYEENEDLRNIQFATSDSFLGVNIQDDNIKNVVATLCQDVHPAMRAVNWVGDADMLLKYITDTQSRCKITLPLHSLGVNISTFNYVKSDNGRYTVGDQQYELVNIDNDYYLSCVTSTIDANEVTTVLHEMISSLTQYGTYVLNRCAYRVHEGAAVYDEDDEEEIESLDKHFIYALRLNTYELSLICAYAQMYQGMQIVEGQSESGEAVLKFTLQTE